MRSKDRLSSRLSRKLPSLHSSRHSPWKFYVLSALTSASDAYYPLDTLRFYISMYVLYTSMHTQTTAHARVWIKNILPPSWK